MRAHYPRYVESPSLNLHGPDYLQSIYDTTVFNWNISSPIGYVDQVPHTYAYTLGAYGIQNEKQVSIGESTCPAVFFTTPKSAGGYAIMQMSTLTEIALERCDTARCAIQTIGDLATQYGFFGDGFDMGVATAQDEAGEALTIADKNEVWMFHILPDDTGTSAVWAAQRVPDDHITVVANHFVIREINLADTENFMASANIFEVAMRNNLWSLESGKPFVFNEIYSPPRLEQGSACTRRVWRIFTRAAPSIVPLISPYTDGYATFGYGPDGKQPYPFSVKPDKLLTVQDVMNFNRDQFEGTPFDITKSLDAGPFGDPMRFAPVSKRVDPVNGITYELFTKGLGFGRPISLGRTAYSSITQSRASLPDVIGALTWIAPYAPHHSTFVPVYANADSTPTTLRTGNLRKLEKNSNWWVHSVTGNYLSRWYKDTIGDVVTLQKQIEAAIFAQQAAAENTALQMLQNSPGNSALDGANDGDVEGAKFARREARQGSGNLFEANPAAEGLGQFQESVAASVVEQWWAFFYRMVAVYRDSFKLVNPHVDNVAHGMGNVGVPRSWMEIVGYWGAPFTPPPGQAEAVPVYPINVPSMASPEAFQQAYPLGQTMPYRLQVTSASYSTTAKQASPSPAPTSSLRTKDATPSAVEDLGEDGSYDEHTLLMVNVLMVLIGAVAGAVAMSMLSKPRGYTYSPIG